MRSALLLGVVAAQCTVNQPPEAARVVLTQPMPPLDGAHLNVTLVEVRYGPGAGSAPHSHPCPVIGHVLEGALRTQVRGGPSQVYRAGESFYEAPNGIHEVSANASDREPVRFMATFVCDRETPRSVPVPLSSRTTP